MQNTWHRWRAGVALQATVENIRDFVWEIYYWDLRTLNNAKPWFCLNDLPAMYSTAFWCLFVVLLVCLALFRIHCYSSFLFTAPTTFFLSRLPHLLRAWNRLLVMWVCAACVLINIHAAGRSQVSFSLPANVETNSTYFLQRHPDW